MVHYGGRLRILISLEDIGLNRVLNFFCLKSTLNLNPESGLKTDAQTKAVIDLYEPVSDSILKPDLVSWYK